MFEAEGVEFGDIEEFAGGAVEEWVAAGIVKLYYYDQTATLGVYDRDGSSSLVGWRWRFETPELSCLLLFIMLI